MIEAGYNVHPEQLLMAETEVYGLISGPSWLRQSLVADFEDLGYVKNPYDKCIMMLPPRNGSDRSPANSNRSLGDLSPYMNVGIILIEVDDLLEGGEPNSHGKAMERFYAKYKCGKRKRLIDLGNEGTLISGIRFRQLKDDSFI